MIEGFEDMTDAERRNLLWAMRDGSEPHINRIRREGFDALKALISERELPASVTHPPAPSKVVRMFNDAAPAMVAGAGMRWPL